jgi:hydrogenase expression/formation protein HypE
VLKAGLGKVDRDFLGRVLLKNTGAKRRSVIVGPGMGLDNAVVSVGPGRVLVVTSDPLSIVPSIGMKDSAWLSVHEIASDLTTSGVSPQFAVLDYNLPPSLSPQDFEEYAVAVSDECRALGVSIIGGHSGRYPGSGFTVVGGGMMMSLAEDRAYVTPKMIRGGDDLVMTKGAAIEATAVLARSFAQRTERLVGSRLASRAASYLRRCSTVEEALAAATLGLGADGVTAMHDATEGGVLGGLYELAQTCGRTLRVEREMVEVSEESRSVCEAYGIDPLVTISEGTLLIACAPERTKRLLGALASRRIKGFKIGSVGGKGARLALSEGGSQRSYRPPKLDPYWEVYARGTKMGWK